MKACMWFLSSFSVAFGVIGEYPHEVIWLQKVSNCLRFLAYSNAAAAWCICAKVYIVHSFAGGGSWAIAWVRLCDRFVFSLYL